MKTPDTKAGRWTEEIMAAWLKRLEGRKEPLPSPGTYNAAFEAVMEVLDRRLPR